MPETVTDIIIAAPAGRIWDVLTDFAEYPEWNPLIRRVSGALAPDARLDITLAASDGSDCTGHPTVVHLRAGREFRWRDRPSLPGILDTETTFKIEPLGSEQARFVFWQRSSGLLAPLLGGGHDARLRGRLDAMNRALKVRVEREAAPAPRSYADLADAPSDTIGGRQEVGSSTDESSGIPSNSGAPERHGRDR